MQKRVSIIGLGYIGLPTAIVAAQAGLEVIGVDIDETRVAKINAGQAVIQEPGVAEKLSAAIGNKLLRATTSIEPADFHIIAVPTPFYENKKADLSYVIAAAESVASVLRAGDTVILESTVPVGTTQKLATLFEEKTTIGIAGQDFFVAHCPERVLPGKIFHELVHNARIVGGINQLSVERAKEFYKSFVIGGLYLTDAKTAEMVKLVENSSRDVAIAFANQVASMARAVGLNGYEVIELANKHPRVNILKPGCGVGGHCIAVDPWFLIEGFPEQTQLLLAARTVNDEKPEEVTRAVQQQVSTESTILILGATYKPDIDDLRESPALHIAQALAKKYTRLLICEPNVPTEQLIKYGFAAEQIVDVKHGIERADTIVALVAHSAFKSITSLRNAKKIIDYCGLLHVPRPDTNQQDHLYWPTHESFPDHSIHADTKEHTP